MVPLSTVDEGHTGVMLCRAQRQLLVLVVIMAGAAFTISNLHRIRLPEGLLPNMFPASLHSTDGASLPPMKKHKKQLLLCPSNIQDMLHSQRDEPNALPWTKASFENIQHCPLINNTIFHNHPTDNAITTRLLIYISHRLREYPARACEDREWIFFLDPAAIHSREPWFPNDLLPSMPGKELDHIHILLSPSNQHSPNANIRPAAALHTQQHGQPPHPHLPQALPMSILAIRMSSFSKVLLERILALQRGPPRRTEDEAVAVAITEYEFVDGVLTVADTSHAML